MTQWPDNKQRIKDLEERRGSILAQIGAFDEEMNIYIDGQANVVETKKQRIRLSEEFNEVTQMIFELQGGSRL